MKLSSDIKCYILLSHYVWMDHSSFKIFYYIPSAGIPAFSTELTNAVTKFSGRFHSSQFQILCTHHKMSVFGHRRTSSLNLQKKVSTVGSLEETTHRTSTYDPINGEVMRADWRIYKRHVISDKEKVGVYL